MSTTAPRTARKTAAQTQADQVLARMEQAIDAEAKAPKAPRKPRAAKPVAVDAPAAEPTPAAAPTPCRCGCGAPTKRPSASYLPGHDARHAGTVGRSVADLDAEQASIRIDLALATPALRAKATGVADKARRAAAIKAARAAAKAEFDARVAAL